MALTQFKDPLFQDLRQTLLKYKNSTTSQQQQMLSAAIDSVNKIGPDIKDKEHAIEAYKTLAYAGQLINYATTLRNMRNSGFFDILVDFKMPDMLKEDKFKELNEYFEFHDKAPMMKIKCNIEAVPPRIWVLFREAQKAQLAKANKAHLFNLDDLDLNKPMPEEQLYPLPILMLGKYDNEAVDRISSTSNGLYDFVSRFGVFLLPGGGMIEINVEKTLENKLLKMLDEHLEEQHGNLWVKATEHYNQVEQYKFVTTLRHCTTDNEKLKPEWRDALELALRIPGEGGTSNSNIVAELVIVIDELLVKNKAARDTNAISDEAYKSNKRDLNVLRSTVQVDALKHTNLYKRAADYIKNNSTVARIEQFCDNRGCGGKNTSNSYIMFGQDLLEFFKKEFDGEDAETADDIRGADLVRMTMLEALSKFRQIKFSHILIALVHQVEALAQNVVQFDNVWKNDQLAAAVDAVRKSASEEIANVEATKAPADKVTERAMQALVSGQGLLANKRDFNDMEAETGLDKKQTGTTNTIK
ncbi:MAG: hypothetical protein WC627_11360 [Legionella sp.]|jgi:hypothetical protein